MTALMDFYQIQAGRSSAYLMLPPAYLLPNLLSISSLPFAHSLPSVNLLPISGLPLAQPPALPQVYLLPSAI